MAKPNFDSLKVATTKNLVFHSKLYCFPVESGTLSTGKPYTKDSTTNCHEIFPPTLSGLQLSAIPDGLRTSDRKAEYRQLEAVLITTSDLRCSLGQASLFAFSYKGYHTSSLTVTVRLNWNCLLLCIPPVLSSPRDSSDASQTKKGFHTRYLVVALTFTLVARNAEKKKT